MMQTTNYHPYVGLGHVDISKIYKSIPSNHPLQIAL